MNISLTILFRVIVLFLAIQLPLRSFSQIVLTRPDFPVVGDQVKVYDQNPATSEGTGGSNIIWDFSFMIVTGNTPSYNFVALTSPNCTSGDLKRGFAPAPMAGENQEYETNNAEFKLRIHQTYFAGSNFTSYCYFTPWVKMTFPFTYNDTIISAFDFTHQVIDGSMMQYNSVGYGTDTTICDGWGTVIFPNGTHNVLRTVSHIHTYDTMSFYSPNFERYILAYNWYTNLNKMPLVTITYYYYLDVATNQFVLTSKQVKAHSNVATGISENDQSESIKIASDHANSSHTLLFNNASPGNYTIEVLDLTGRIQMVNILNVTNNRESHTINLSSISAGLYLINILTPDNRNSLFKVIR